MKTKAVTGLAGLISALLYYFIFYDIQRYQSLPLILVYSVLFAVYLYFIYSRNHLQTREIIGLAIIFRMIPLLAIPALSDDFYRFIWDGIIWSNGINPFAFTPSKIMADGIVPVTTFLENIYTNLNSQSTYTVYPTIPQLINLIAYKIGGDHLLSNVIIQRVFIIAADLLAIYFLIKILTSQKWPSTWVVLYALNPLVIIELSGNLHHEALMIAFIMGFIYLDRRQKVIGSGLMFALSVAAKVLPLMFMPFLLLRSKSRLTFLASVALGVTALFLPLIDLSFFQGMQASLTLYYQNFEFNAGIYYLVREIGYWIYGYNAIALIGKLFFVLTTVLILLISWLGYKLNYKKPVVFILIYLTYALLSLILHPWYILLLIALTPLTRSRFSITWSFLIFLTYLGYHINGFSENYWVLLVEYLGLFVAIFTDWRNQAFSNETLKEAP